jgi:HD-GYP domain-containing protein (c-di-GMP phosphodiesterase class II)
MDLDSYLTPAAERLLRSARERRDVDAEARSSLNSEAVAAALVLVGAVALAALSPRTSPLTVPALGVSVVAYLIARHIRFPVGSAWTMPTQLVFVPMLFVLPTPLVPLIVAACSVLDLAPEALQGRLTATRLTGRIADCFYALVPATVLVVGGAQQFSWDQWPLLVLAFGSQLVLDAAFGLARTWWADRVLPSDQPQMLWLYFTDACFSCVGLTIAAAADRRPGLILMTLPLFVLLSVFADERQRRLERTLELSSAYDGAAKLLGDLIDAVDHYTGVHTRDVVELSTAVSEAMSLDETRRRDVEYAALLHDVGKIRVPQAIINKPGKLDESEWAVMRRHTIEGELMLRQVGGTLAGVGRFVRASHERYDGGGYPDGLVGEAIPLESRIVCVCDAYNAMTTDRPYRAARRDAEALEELRRCSGTQFDPDVVEVIEHVLAGRSSPDAAAPPVTAD